MTTEINDDTSVDELGLSIRAANVLLFESKVHDMEAINTVGLARQFVRDGKLLYRPGCGKHTFDEIAIAVGLPECCFNRFKLHEKPVKGMDDHTLFLTRIRMCLKRWAARYAASDHAKLHVQETQLLVQEIDEWLLKQ